MSISIRAVPDPPPPGETGVELTGANLDVALSARFSELMGLGTQRTRITLSTLKVLPQQGNPDRVSVSVYFRRNQQRECVTFDVSNEVLERFRSATVHRSRAVLKDGRLSGVGERPVDLSAGNHDHKLA